MKTWASQADPGFSGAGPSVGGSQDDGYFGQGHSQKAKVFSCLEEALKRFDGSRELPPQRDKPGLYFSPRNFPGDPPARPSIPVAILFGPEDRGLTNRELDPCHA
jgi:tRNA C32,U32 (ribose-2'-O)-methylase TrmJ